MTPKQVMAGIFERFVDKPGHNMLASEVVRKLGDAGYVVVPREPTETMVDACGNGECGKWARGAWAQMIEAALQSPAR